MAIDSICRQRVCCFEKCISSRTTHRSGATTNRARKKKKKAIREMGSPRICGVANVSREIRVALLLSCIANDRVPSKSMLLGSSARRREVLPRPDASQASCRMPQGRRFLRESEVSALRKRNRQPRSLSQEAPLPKAWAVLAMLTPHSDARTDTSTLTAGACCVAGNWWTFWNAIFIRSAASSSTQVSIARPNVGTGRTSAERICRR